MTSVEWLLSMILLVQIVSILMAQRSMRRNRLWLLANAEVLKWQIRHGYGEVPTVFYDEFLNMQSRAITHLKQID